jgi:hypothetical protein
MHVGPILSLLIVPHVAKNSKSGTNRSHRRLTANCRIAKSCIAVRPALCLTRAVTDFSALRKVTGVARRIGKSLRKKKDERSKISYSADRKAATIAAIQSQSEVGVKPRHPGAAVVAGVWCVALFALVPSICAQEGVAPRHTGVPQDWSQHHIVFSRDALARRPDLIYREARILHQVMQRWQVPTSGVFHGAEPLPTAAAKSGLHRDWNVSPFGGKVVPFNFPAKFSFDVGAPPDCTNDYVVFGLSSAGVTGGTANLVAFNNLYVNSSGTGFCSGTAPNVLFAYNTTTVTGGKITTSPILSLDGTKIGFVESIPGATHSAIFHVVTWAAGPGQGTIGGAVLPPAMSSVPFSLSANDSSSSPWIDYGNDIVYVGSDNGLVYKITGVFHGVPALSGSPWPVTVSTGLHLTSPVLDSGLGLLMVGSANGNLYQINTATGALAGLPIGAGTSHGIVAAPLVDITNGTTFVVSANDGTTAVLVEADTVSMTQLSKGQIGEGAAGGTALNIHDPDLSNNYYITPASGVIRVCGTGAADTTPWQYAFGFTGRTMHSIPAFSQQLLTSTAARCTGLTEFFNPNVGGGTDYFFFGLTKDCTVLGGGGADGCVTEITDADPTTVLTTTVTNGPSGIVVDNYSTDAEAASIYFTAEGVNTAYKFTQNGLN